MRVPLLKTKLYIPNPKPNAVRRSRLVERLDNGLKDKLTLISTPAGYGKTTLLSEWIASQGQPVAWLSLDAGDNDPTRFWSYIIAAIQTFEPAFGITALNSIQSSQPPPIETTISSLINEILDFSSPFTLILDDYHLIEARSIHSTLTFTLDHMPPQMHLILATRSDPPLPISTLRGCGKLNELRTADLRFTQKETEAFMNCIMGLNLSNQEVVILNRRTEGWIVGLQLAALSMRDHLDKHTFILNMAGDNRYIADYLMGEVLQGQSPKVQDFLLKTSILYYLNGAICHAVTGLDNCHQILLELEQDNLFIEPLDRNRQWFRYHHLFRDLLRVRLAQSCPDQIPVLHHRASHWYDVNDLPREAIEHAFAIDDFERATALIEESVIDLVSHSEIETVVAWLDKIPDEYIPSHPWLSVARAWTLVSAGQPADAEEQLKVAEMDTSQSQDRQRISGHIATIRSVIAALNGDQLRVLSFSQVALKNLPHKDYMARGLASIMLGLALRWSGELPGAIEAYTKAEEIGRKANDSFVSVFASCYKGYALILSGELHRADTTLREAIGYAEKSASRGGWKPPISGLAYSFLAGVLLEWNQLEDAITYARTGLDLCEKWGHAHAVIDSHFFYTNILIAHQDFVEAREAIQRVKELASANPAVFGLDVAMLEIEMNLAQGDIHQAAQRINDLGLEPGDKITFQTLQYYIPLAKILWLKGESEEAIHLLERLLLIAKKSTAMGRVIEILLLQALIVYQSGSSTQAITLVEQAVRLAKPEGYIWTFIRLGLPMRELLLASVMQGSSPTYVGKLLASIEDKTISKIDYGKPSMPSLVDPLSGRELQVLRLLAAGLSSTEIAEELIIAVGTARTHIKHIYRKLNVHRRLEAIDRAKGLNLI